MTSVRGHFQVESTWPLFSHRPRVCMDLWAFGGPLLLDLARGVATSLTVWAAHTPVPACPACSPTLICHAAEQGGWSSLTLGFIVLVSCGLSVAAWEAVRRRVLQPVAPSRATKGAGGVWLTHGVEAR